MVDAGDRRGGGHRQSAAVKEGKDLNPYTEIYWRDLAKTGIGSDARTMVKHFPPEKHIEFFAEFLRQESKGAVESVGGGLVRSLLSYVLENEINWKELAAILLQDHRNN